MNIKLNRKQLIPVILISVLLIGLLIGSLLLLYPNIGIINGDSEPDDSEANITVGTDNIRGVGVEMTVLRNENVESLTVLGPNQEKKQNISSNLGDQTTVRFGSGQYYIIANLPDGTEDIVETTEIQPNKKIIVKTDDTIRKVNSSGEVSWSTKINETIIDYVVTRYDQGSEIRSIWVATSSYVVEIEDGNQDIRWTNHDKGNISDIAVHNTQLYVAQNNKIRSIPFENIILEEENPIQSVILDEADNLYVTTTEGSISKYGGSKYGDGKFNESRDKKWEYKPENSTSTDAVLPTD